MKNTFRHLLVEFCRRKQFRAIYFNYLICIFLLKMSNALIYRTDRSWIEWLKNQFFHRWNFLLNIKKENKKPQQTRAYSGWGIYTLFIATYLKSSNAAGVSPGMLEMETQPMNDHVIPESNMRCITALVHRRDFPSILCRDFFPACYALLCCSFTSLFWYRASCRKLPIFLCTSHTIL